jgi:predicted PurR-regulated permease PerM
MIKRSLLIIAVILFIILTFVTDFGLYLLLAVIMAFVTWLLTKTGERKAGEVIVQIGTAMIVVPMIFLLIVFFIKAQLNPEAVNELAAKAIDQIVTFFAENLPFVLLSDVAGAIVGSIVGAFQRR